MNDDDLDVRKAAFAALKPIQESGYDPEADKAKRQSALAKWEEWLAKITGKDGDKTAKH